MRVMKTLLCPMKCNLGQVTICRFRWCSVGMLIRPVCDIFPTLIFCSFIDLKLIVIKSRCRFW